MPFLAVDETGYVYDACRDEVEKSGDYKCPSCGETLQYRRAVTNDDGDVIRRPHFWHVESVGGNNGLGGCSGGGESARHETLKREVVQRLRENYSGEVYVEKQVGNRVADVLVEFKEVYGAATENPLRVAVEVQVANEGKDYLRTTKAYLRHETAVHWVFDVTDTLEMVVDAKRELAPYLATPTHLGEADEDSMALGKRIYFDNFEYCVESFKAEFHNCPSKSTTFGPDYEFGGFEQDGKPIRFYADIDSFDEKVTPDKLSSMHGEIDVMQAIESGQLKRTGPYPISKSV
jgi:hypothetical protein